MTDPVIPTGGRLLVVTDRVLAEGASRALRDTVASAVDAGAREVLLREKDLPPPERYRLAVELRAVTARSGAYLYVAGDPELAVDVEADGLHLAATDPWPDPWPDEVRMRVGRSCHTVAELVAAHDRHADWMTYSPVFTTGSKPGYGPALGVDGLARGCAAVHGAAVLALGGVGPGRARGCTDAGAAGVAVMGAVMGAADSAAVVRELLGELGSIRSEAT